MATIAYLCMKCGKFVNMEDMPEDAKHRPLCLSCDGSKKEKTNHREVKNAKQKTQ